MAKCRECGKSGFLLKVNVRGLCKECAAKAKQRPKSGQIIIGGEKHEEYARIGHDDERSACQYFIDQLSDRGKDKDLFKIEHRASDYTSLIYDQYNDFLRVKITDRGSWISLDLTEEDREIYKDDPLFEDRGKKNIRHWKSYFEGVDQLERYLAMAEHACTPIPVIKVRDLTPSERKVADYLCDLFEECGADPGEIYYDIVSGLVEFMYLCRAGSMRFKAYARKPGGYFVLDYIMEKAGITGEKGQFPFTDLSDLDCLKEKVIPEKMKLSAEMKPFTEETYTPYKK